MFICVYVYLDSTKRTCFSFACCAQHFPLMCLIVSLKLAGPLIYIVLCQDENGTFSARSTQIFDGGPLHLNGGRSSNGFRKLESGPRCYVVSKLRGTKNGKGSKKSSDSRLQLAQLPLHVA